MRVLVAKLTSMGDVLHALPAICDLLKANPNAEIDWMVESSFAEVPAWHPGVRRVIPMGTRRWRSLSIKNIKDFFSALKGLRQQKYDVVIDAQGLMKSAVLCRFAKLRKGGVRVGFSGQSIKESPAARLYQQRVDVDRKLHAVTRLRELFSQAFNYVYDESSLDYGISSFEKRKTLAPTVLLLHGTTWATKHLPDATWREIAALAIKDGYQVMLAWGNEVEKQRADWVAEESSHIRVLPKTNLSELKGVIAHANAAIAVDTGLGHLAAALGVPTLSVYGATDSQLTGTAGENQHHWQSGIECSPCLLKECPKLSVHIKNPPCYDTADASTLWKALRDKII